MSGKEPGRRGFLKKGVALASWAAAGGAGLAKGQAADAPAPENSAKDLEAHGERSHYVTSARIFLSRPTFRNTSPAARCQFP